MSEDLPQIRPNAARGAQTVARCHARLEARRQRLEKAGTPKAVTAERFVLVGTCFAYLVSMVGTLARMIAPQ